MAGGLLQLSNGTGAQDKILTAKPEVTFFKSMYRQHTNFAIESIPQTLQGEPNFGQSTACTIARNGDLVHRIYLELVFEDYTKTSGDLPSPSNFGYKMIKSACLEIGGTTIDKHYGEWMELWSMLSTPAGVMKAHSAMVGEADKFNTTGSGVRVCIPLHFWFCRNPGLALPLIALQFHEVKLRIDFNEKSSVWVPNNGSVCPDVKTAKVWADYIYLDTDERRNFAKKTQEYIIEQVQCTGSEVVGSSNTLNVRLNFNQPVKELIWGFKDSAKNNNTSDAPNWQTNGGMFETAKIQLNGHDRFAERCEDYFRVVQPYQHHGNSGEIVGGTVFSAAPYVYSFSLSPEEPQPSGTCNFSRIDNAQLNIEGYTGTEHQGDVLWIFATNYNVLKIMSGMGGLAYSN